MAMHLMIVIVMMVLSLSNGDEEDDGFRRIQKLMKLMKMMVEKQSGLEKGANPKSNVPEKKRLVRVFAAQLSTWPINS
ncbi:hypothetical protein IHE45_13G065000 [Dioscorea alata]|uniref:Uncharacterized protein n=1 Tax=Dioscorea alata TaxID=55571 RepID=A0ACB7UYH7_DIOAL|nr:hypothetical protein IHE45_13G065000 [Dioscorea alata]